MDLLIALGKLDKLTLILLLCIIIAFFSGRRFEWISKIRLLKSNKEAKASEDLAKAVISTVEVSGKLTELLSQDKDRLADSIAMQAATFEKISDAQLAIKIGVDTLILNDQDAKTFISEVRSRLDRLADCDDKLKNLIVKLDVMGVNVDV